MKFVLVLAILSFLGFFISLPAQLYEIKIGLMQYSDLIINSLDLVTITVPPALPTALSIGISFALIRLKKKQIFCISSTKVNVCGKISTVCFDKTGTLTEDGLDIYGVRPVVLDTVRNETQFQKICFNPIEL